MEKPRTRQVRRKETRTVICTVHFLPTHVRTGGLFSFFSLMKKKNIHTDTYVNRKLNKKDLMPRKKKLWSVPPALVHPISLIHHATLSVPENKITRYIGDDCSLTKMKMTAMDETMPAIEFWQIFKRKWNLTERTGEGMESEAGQRREGKTTNEKLLGRSRFDSLLGHLP